MATARVLMVDVESVDATAMQRFRDSLSAGEQARCGRFVRALRLRQFVVGRVLARQALGQVLGVPAQSVQLAEQVAGAPLLVAPVRGQAGFSISHSGRWVACAASEDTALGLDIEIIDAGRDLSALAGQAFDAAEMAQWRQVQTAPEAQRVAGFYRLWSEKEARFKLGAGSQPGNVVTLAHADLSVVLCSALPLAAPPAIERVVLTELPAPA